MHMSDALKEKKKCGACKELREHPAAIRRAKAQALPPRQAQRAAELFKALGDVTRVRVLQMLSKRELCVCDIAAAVKLSQSAVSHQLRVLRGARLVKYRKDGKNAWYSVSDKHVASLLRQGIAHAGHE